MRKFLVLSSCLALILGSTPAWAGEIAAVNQNLHRNIVEVTPFNLVEHGYQGYFKEQGIPSYAAFLTAIRSRKVQAEDLVKSAIARGRLAPETLNDRSYLDAVKLQIDNLERFSR
jgi:Zn-finger domain-containing protein